MKAFKEARDLEETGPIPVFFTRVMVAYDASNMTKVIHVQRTSSVFR